MKRYFLIAFFALFCLSAEAQNYKPLEAVDVPDYPTNEIRIQENKRPWGGTYYTASHMLHARRIEAELGVPPVFDMWLDNKSNLTGSCTAKMSIGGEDYFLYVDYISTDGKSISINLKGAHIKHIAVSGLQSITYLKNGDFISIHEFNPIEQELWRRTAEGLADAVEKFKIL